MAVRESCCIYCVTGGADLQALACLLGQLWGVSRSCQVEICMSRCNLYLNLAGAAHGAPILTCSTTADGLQLPSLPDCTHLSCRAASALHLWEDI